MTFRGGPPRPLAGFMPLDPADVLAEAQRIHGAPDPYDPSSSAPPPAREHGCDDGEEVSDTMSFPGTPGPERGAGEQKDDPAANLAYDGHKPAGGGGARDHDPAPNSPGDAGYLDQEQLAGGVVTPVGSPAPADAPETHECKSCGARIYWVQLVDENGSRQRRADNKGWKAMPVDAQPDPVKGNVFCYRPKGARTLYGRVLRHGDAVPPGARLRTSHFATCPNAQQHRRKRR